VEPEAIPSVLELVVDTSGSMNEAAPGTAFASKWTVTRGAVLDAIGGLPDEVSVGVIFYPDQDLGFGGGVGFLPGFFGGNNPDGCFDPSGRAPIDTLGGSGSPQRGRIERAFESQSPRGGTPTHDAYRFGLSELQNAPTNGGRVLVLITDGVPTHSLGCQGTGQADASVDPNPLIAEAAAATELGMRTFVIGSPGSEGASESLSRMAEAGGTAAQPCSHAGPNHCHLDMTKESDLGIGLANALGDISRVPEPGNAALDLTKVNVVLTPANGLEELITRASGRLAKKVGAIPMTAAKFVCVRALANGCVARTARSRWNSAASRKCSKHAHFMKDRAEKKPG
jgi:hypothetical protein